MDQKHIENTKRVAKNTVFLYGRMLFGMLVALYTSRVILKALGVEDFGIFGVVGGLVSMFSLISSALTSSISRFITFELGKNNQSKLKEVFSTSLLIQLSLSILVLLLAETIGIWFINNELIIPHERLYAANWVFQASVLGFIIGLLNTPFNAALVAHERMNIYAYFGILRIFLNLGIVLFVAYATFEFDRLIIYSILMVCVSLVMQSMYWIYCYHHFSECRVYPSFKKQCWKEMSGFAGWNGIGCTAAILKDQGVNVLLNLFFGPVVNAARGIASSVSNAVGQFSGNFMTALNPQITKSYASGDHLYMFSLVERGSRFGYYIMLIFSLPIILESPYILKLWLNHFPENTVIFVRLVMLYSLIEVLSSTLITLQTATGKIRDYQLVVGGLLLLNFPFSWLALHMGAEPYAVYIVAICIGISCLMTRLWFLRSMVGLSMLKYLKCVVGNVIFTTICASIFPFIIYLILPSDFFRVIMVFIISIISSSLAIFFVGCKPSERNFILSKILMLKSKFIRLTA